MALPTPESLIGMKLQEAKTLVETEGGTIRVYRRYQNPTDVEPIEDMMDDADWQPTRYNVALDRGNIIVDSNCR